MEFWQLSSCYINIDLLVDLLLWNGSLGYMWKQGVESLVFVGSVYYDNCSQYCKCTIYRSFFLPWSALAFILNLICSSEQTKYSRLCYLVPVGAIIKSWNSVAYWVENTNVKREKSMGNNRYASSLLVIYNLQSKEYKCPCSYLQNVLFFLWCWI